MTAERLTTERLREALLALADEMDEADVMSGPGTGEYADRIREALAAAPVDRDGLREALEQALDRMETAWGLLNPDIWSDAARVQGGPAEGVSQALYFGIEEAERALAAAPVDRDGLTPLQREVAEAPACVRCERAITTLGDLYRCAQCNGAFHLTCIHEHFGWTVNGAPDAERHAATPDRDGLDVDALENIIREQSYRKDRPGEWAAAVAREYAAIKEKP